MVNGNQLDWLTYLSHSTDIHGVHHINKNIYRLISEYINNKKPFLYFNIVYAYVQFCFKYQIKMAETTRHQRQLGQREQYIRQFIVYASHNAVNDKIYTQMSYSSVLKYIKNVDHNYFLYQRAVNYETNKTPL